MFLKFRYNLWKYLRKSSFPSPVAGYKPATQLKTKPPIGILKKPHPDPEFRRLRNKWEPIFRKPLNGCLLRKKKKRKKKDCRKKPKKQNKNKNKKEKTITKKSK